jgi:hypothetical protein
MKVISLDPLADDDAPEVEAKAMPLCAARTVVLAARALARRNLPRVITVLELMCSVSIT